MTEQSGIEPQSLTSNLREQAANAVTKQYGNLAQSNPIEFIKECHKKFCELKLLEFPRMCEIARMQNYLKWKELNEIDQKGKFSNSTGWSADRQFRFEYEIPQELYMFMQNLVYDKFWEQENRPIWRKFMKKVCDGADPEYVLKWVRTQYGTEAGKVTSHGL